MRTPPARVNIRRAALIFVASIISASCSEKSGSDQRKDVTASETPRELAAKSDVKKSEAEGEQKPDEDMIAQDCVALVRATKIVPAGVRNADCPGCPAGGTEILGFRGMQTNATSCSGETCNVVVTIRVVFNPGSGEKIAGGLTAWIAPELRSAYLTGHPPSGEQAYRVRITYKRRGAAWRAVEFDRAP